MAIIDELRNIDVSAVVDARTAIKAAVNSPALTRVLEGGAAKSALGELGSLIDGVQSGDPAALIRPLADGLGSLHVHFDLASLPIGRYASSISDGLGIVATVTAGLDGDISKLGEGFGLSLDGVLQQAHGGAGTVIASTFQAGGLFWNLMSEVDRGMPGGADAMVDLLLRGLLPLPSGSLGDLRTRISALHTQAGAIALPSTRTDGLVTAFAKVEAAAAAKDPAALQQALRFLEQVRLSTVGTLCDDLMAINTQVRKLDLSSIVAPLARADKELRGLAEGLLDQIARWRDMLAVMRKGIESIDPAVVTKYIDDCVSEAEQFIRDTILAFIDEQVRRVVEWFRSLFRHIPIASIRAELTAFLHRIAKAINDADLGRFARDAHALLDTLRDTVAPDAIKAEIQKALAAAGQAIDDALDEVLEKLDVVKDAVEAVAEEAGLVIGRIVPALAGFNAAVLEIKAGAGEVGIEQAGQKVIEQLESLREAAEKLLTEAPLPDALKDEVANVVDFVRGIDLDAAFQPVRAAASQLALPDDLAAAVDHGLAEAATVIDNLIPSRLAADIEADLHEALDRIARFNPAALLPDMKGFLDEAASAVEKLTPPPDLAADLHAPFQKLLDLIDAAHPATLLAPAIQAFDKALAALPLPSGGGDVAGPALEFVTSLGERAANALMAPLQGLVGGGSGGAPPAAPTGGGGTGAGASNPQAGNSGATPTTGSVGASSPGAVPPPDLRPGDIIRLLGYIPGQLRAQLMKLEKGTVGQVMARLDGLTAGLARDLRATARAIAEVDTRVHANVGAMLDGLGHHQVRAQLAVRANFTAGQIDMHATMSAIALAGPGELRHALGSAVRSTRDTTYQAAATLSRTVGAQLLRTADALDACLLSKFAGNLDALLAALDPEPIAAEVDALFLAALTKAPQLVAAIGEALKSAVARVRALFNAFNPGVLAQKFFVVLDVLREQLDLFSPRRLAAELGEIHAAIRGTIAAFDPGAFIEDLAATVKAIAASLRALDPATLVGDLTFLQEAVAKIEAAVPTQALAEVGAELNALGEQLADVDLEGLLEAVRTLAPEVVEEAEKVAAALKQEVIALLESLQYANGGASASASVEVHA